MVTSKDQETKLSTEKIQPACGMKYYKLYCKLMTGNFASQANSHERRVTLTLSRGWPLRCLPMTAQGKLDVRKVHILLTQNTSKGLRGMICETGIDRPDRRNKQKLPRCGCGYV